MDILSCFDFDKLSMTKTEIADFLNESLFVESYNSAPVGVKKYLSPSAVFSEKKRPGIFMSGRFQR
jgi:hypothetical protein